MTEKSAREEDEQEQKELTPQLVLRVSVCVCVCVLCVLSLKHSFSLNRMSQTLRKTQWADKRGKEKTREEGGE